MNQDDKEEFENLETIPINKVNFKVDEKKNVVAESSLNPDVNKKFASILKKREEAIAKKMREQLQVRSKIIFNEGAATGSSFRPPASYNTLPEGNQVQLSTNGFRAENGKNKSKRQLNNASGVPKNESPRKIPDAAFYDFQSQASSNFASKMPSLTSKQKNRSNHSSS